VVPVLSILAVVPVLSILAVVPALSNPVDNPVVKAHNLWEHPDKLADHLAVEDQLSEYPDHLLEHPDKLVDLEFFTHHLPVVELVTYHLPVAA
jgi:hypothetical protein